MKNDTNLQQIVKVKVILKADFEKRQHVLVGGKVISVPSSDIVQDESGNYFVFGQLKSSDYEKMHVLINGKIIVVDTEYVFEMESFKFTMVQYSLAQ